MQNNLIVTIPAKKIEKFKDPFKYDEPKDGIEENQDSVSNPNIKTVEEESVQTYILGKNKPKALEGGDAGGILKKTKYYPLVNFVRS